ncbi:MAG: AbrB family transcriptional regulator [Acidaminococcaceae bacterium]
MIFQVVIFGLSAIVGSLFNLAGMPIPWLLGGLAVGLAAKTKFAENAVWPRVYRSAGLIVIGYSIGRYLTISALHEMPGQIAGMVGATISAVLVALLIAFWTAKKENIDLQSCIMGIMPGGFTQMAIMCDEDDRADKNIVILMQSLRLMSVIIAVPFLVMHFLDARIVSTAASLAVNDGLSYWYILPIAAIGGIVADRLKISTPYLLAPIIIAMVFSLQLGNLNTIDPLLMMAAQISIGLNMGMGLDPKELCELKRILPYTFAGIIVMLMVSIGVALLLSAHYGYSLVTAFLAMAPGGLGEMCLVGLSLNESVSVILIYQLFRFLFLNIAVPIGLNLYFGKSTEKVLE